MNFENAARQAQPVARIPERVEKGEGGNEALSSGNAVEHFPHYFVEGPLDYLDMDVGRDFYSCELLAQVRYAVVVKLDEVEVHVQSAHAGSALVVEVGVEHQERAAGLTARIAAGAGKPVDEVQPAVSLRHDREPGVQVSDQESVFGVCVLLVFPEHPVRSRHRRNLFEPQEGFGGRS